MDQRRGILQLPTDRCQPLGRIPLNSLIFPRTLLLFQACGRDTCRFSRGRAKRHSQQSWSALAGLQDHHLEDWSMGSLSIHLVKTPATV